MLVRNLTESGSATFNPSAANQANILANAINANKGTMSLGSGSVIDQLPIPSSLTVTITSDDDADGVATTTNIFNNSFLTAAATDNGGGANTMTTTWGDGFSGRVYEQLFKVANGGRGVLITGFTLIASNYTTGAQIATPFNTLNLNLNIANGKAGLIPNPITLAEAVRNTQYQSGILTPVVPFMLNPLCQLNMLVPKNTTLAFTFFTQTASFNG